jgi:competence protein ComEC
MSAIRAAARLVARCFLLSVVATAPAASQTLVIRFFDVGQGDAALITSPEGKTALIDGGPNAGTVASFLHHDNIDTLDLVIASHNHADHIRGLQDVLRTTTVRFYMDNGIPATTQVYLALIDELTAQKITYLKATPRTIQLGSVSLRILPLPPDVAGQNNSSVGVLLSYGDFTALFTGDAEYLERDFWRANANLPHVTLLKVSHHGSINGTDAPWIEATRPRYAIISVGANNRYGHPSPQTLQTLGESGVEIYQTSETGTIEVSVDLAGAITIRTETSGAGPPTTPIHQASPVPSSEGSTTPNSSPAAGPDIAPRGATAQCRDGTFSYSTHHSGTCSHHHGVAQWL